MALDVDKLKAMIQQDDTNTQQQQSVVMVNLLQFKAAWWKGQV